ncbi:tRNA (adenosine(37)-N6)-threonylcarbamoyltransferase complex dimerization subunit type 1 TsaB [Nodosilinea sp. E11]|uniref:tRNA (adenosine(37)-N6)-threonylcarbamoyltransferase complex dimerization subunit type 1 TsaB n=1 Tax=Nodosilinea sp. E11 TaxID=3037479 RepID=UPI0029348E20|nr:tRNA (adenosine(37)-N6)-threonylcarbamoyltransferase complex dimerization subunit type 1 TsaB [Nodosilinea sp. E11]WOD41334.1 tRNA (adenosine(37)-N6)-threonylcarbamoyltransferase complex dimerization subunit type 1 TsaB [Nodosilinea sp. E11]
MSAIVGLAIHTCGPALGLALCDVKGEICHQSWPLGRDLSTQLHSILMEFIAPHRWQDVAFLAVAMGPGGFTGTRVGVVTARTLAQQLEIPLFGVSSLAAIAQRALADQTPGAADIAVEMQAQRGQLYTAIYRPTPNGLAVVQSEQVRSPEDWEAALNAHPHPLARAAAGDDLAATVVQVLELAQGGWARGDRPDWSTVLPYYGQHPVDR